MSDIEIEILQENLKDIINLARNNKDISEEELRSYFIKKDILKVLGWQEIGKDIRLERTVKGSGKRSDIICIDAYGNIIFIIEFKKPSDPTPLNEHFPQLWNNYVLPLKSTYGILLNGLQLIIYQRIMNNEKRLLTSSLDELGENDVKLISNLLKKPSLEFTKIEAVVNYFKRFNEEDLKIQLNSDISRQLFFDNFQMRENSIFNNFVLKIIDLFDHIYIQDNIKYSKFLKSAFDFWVKSYSKKPDQIPENWRKLLSAANLTANKNDLNKFMFCLETAYALFARLILAKACEDYGFPNIEFSIFIENEVRSVSRRDKAIPLLGWGKLVVNLIDNMRLYLVESVFEEDIYYWWTEYYQELSKEKLWDPGIAGDNPALVEFAKPLRDLILALYKYDFSEIAGDPLGDLYQKYFDKETRKALGEFYTPKDVVEYIVDNVNYNGKRIIDRRLLDPACGSGTFLVYALKKYLSEAENSAKYDGWGKVISKLCNEYHIVGFDIHPFATIMAQIQFMLALMPYYKKAIDENSTFTLKRLPIFRTDSLIDESRTEEVTLDSFQGNKSMFIEFTLPIKDENEKFISPTFIMPFHKDVISDKTGLINIPEYFAALQALFDTVKHNAKEQEGRDKYRLDRGLLRDNLMRYLPSKDWNRLVIYFSVYGQRYLDEIHKLKYKFGDGRLVKTIEDIILAGILKNQVQFDYVVGNPPYIRVQKLTEEQKNYIKNIYDSATGKFDLYVIFVERGIKWLNSEGNLGYIISNQFMLREYGEGIRRIASKDTHIRQILDFGDSGVFKDATNYPCIIICSKLKDNDQVNCARVASPVIYNEKDITLPTILEHCGSEYRSNSIDTFVINQERFNEKPWLVMPSYEQVVFDKIHNTGETLKSIEDDIFEGLITGNNEAFIIDENIVRDNNIERHLIKPVPKGNTVRKWTFQEDERFVIYPHEVKDGKVSAIELVDYPNANLYLERFKERLEKREYAKKAGKKWYEIWNPRDPRLFERIKIITPNLSQSNNFALDTGRKRPDGVIEFQYIDHDCYGILLKNTDINYHMYIMGLLNSKLLEFYLKHISPYASGKYYRYMSIYLEQLPIKTTLSEEEIMLRGRIIECVKIVRSKLGRLQKMNSFPREYIQKFRSSGTEFDIIRHIFKQNNIKIKTQMSCSSDSMEFIISLGKNEDPIFVDSKEKAEYVSIFLENIISKKGDAIEIMVPRNNNISIDILNEFKRDRYFIDSEPTVSQLEDEINKLVYTIYAASEDRSVVEEFIRKF